MPDAPLEVRAPTAEGGREYTRVGHQSRKGGENIPAVGTTNRGRGENMRVSITALSFFLARHDTILH
eukprot:3475720-Pyramimonas_sp.AAC.1